MQRHSAIAWAAVLAVAAHPGEAPTASSAGSSVSHGSIVLAQAGKRKTVFSRDELEIQRQHKLKDDTVFMIVRTPGTYEVYKKHMGTTGVPAFFEATPTQQGTINQLRVAKGLNAISLSNPYGAMAARRDHEYEIWKLANVYGISSVPDRVDLDGQPYLKAGFAGFSSEAILLELADKRRRGDVDQGRYEAGVNYVISTAIDTLAKLEDAAIVHRDPHAGNLTIMTDAGRTFLKGQAIDFGMSKRTGEAESDLQIKLAGIEDVMGKDKYKPTWANEPGATYILAENPAAIGRSYADHKSDLYYFLTSVSEVLRSGEGQHNVAINNSLNQMRLEDRTRMQSAKQYTEQLKGVYLPGWHQGQAIVRDVLDAKYKEVDAKYQQ